jgi:outer membrane beta-barrel protein
MSKVALCAFLVSSVASTALAEVKIQFPEEELATESVLPVFEDRVAVRNRKVEHKGKFEINLMGGLVTSEPIYDPLNFGLSLSYHFNNTQGIHIMGTVFSDGLSGSGESLRNGNVVGDGGGSANITFDASQAPNKEFMLAAHYQYTAYYGKISLARDSIMNLSLSGLLGGGFYMMDGLTAPTVNFGVSQRYYFNSRVALRFDILFSIFNGPDITSAGPLRTNAPTKPDPGEFEKSMQFDSNIFLGLSLLI